MATIINLTPHDVRLFVNGVCTHIWPGTPYPARVRLHYRDAELSPGVPISQSTCDGFDNLPEAVDGTYLIVSNLVLEACSDRLDLIAPDTKQMSQVRDRRGELVGIRRFRTALRHPLAVKGSGLTVLDNDV